MINHNVMINHNIINSDIKLAIMFVFLIYHYDYDSDYYD